MTPSTTRGQALEGAGTAAIGNSDVLCEHLRHGEDFAMQAEVRLVRGAGQRPAEAHLLIRGGSGGMHEAGLVLVAERDAAIVRYRAGGVTYVDRFWPLRQRIEFGRWYRLSLSVRDGAVRGEIDGEPVFDSRSDSLPPRLRAWRDSVGAPSPSVPPGVFVEPHLAARSGTAQFRVVQLLVRPDDRWAFVR